MKSRSRGQIVAIMGTAPEWVAFVDSCRPRHASFAPRAIGCRSALALNWVCLCAAIARTRIVCNYNRQAGFEFTESLYPRLEQRRLG
jgi:hypothetical protein